MKDEKLSGAFADSAIPDLDQYWHPKDPALSEKHFRTMLAELKDPAGANSVVRIDLLLQIARAEVLQGKLPEAIATLEAVTQYLEVNPSEVPVRTRIRLLLEEGRILTLQRTPSQARTRFAKAWELAVNAESDYFVVEIARAMAEIEPPKMQEVWIRKAIEVASESAQDKAKLWLGELYEDLGWRLFDLRQFDESLAAHKCSLNNYRAFDSQEGAHRASWAIGRLLRQLRRIPEALAWNEALLLEIPGSGHLFGRICEEVAECLLSAKGPVAAQDYFARAYRELSRSSVQDRHPLGLKRLKQLGKVDA